MNRNAGRIGLKRKKMKRRKNRIWYAAGFLLPGLAGVSLFYLLSFAEVVRRSFLQSASGRFVGAENYRQVFANQAFWRAVKNTAVFVGAGVPVLLLQLLTDRSGLWNGLWKLQIDYMNTVWAVVIVLLAFWWKNTGYMAVLWLTGLASVPRELEEAAAVDGAGKWARLVCITLPQLSGSFFTILMLSILQSFKSYREIWMAAGNYPQENIYLLQHLLQNWYLKMEFDRMAALTVLLALLLLVFCFLLQRRLERE